MATINEMRKYVADEYPDSVGWHQKVAKMPTNQVIAIFKRFKNHKINEKKKRLEEESYHQIDIWEYMTHLALEKSWTGSHTDIKLDGIGIE